MRRPLSVNFPLCKYQMHGPRRSQVQLASTQLKGNTGVRTTPAWSVAAYLRSSTRGMPRAYLPQDFWGVAFARAGSGIPVIMPRALAALEPTASHITLTRPSPQSLAHHGPQVACVWLSQL